MSSVFLDTSGLVAVVNSKDHWHHRATDVWRELMEQGQRLMTTSIVLIEIGDGLSRVHQRDLAVELYERLHCSAQVEIVQITSDIEAEGWQLFRERSDKEWGMTDYISMVVMNHWNLRRIFTTDRHFEQAGFEILLPNRTE